MTTPGLPLTTADQIHVGDLAAVAEGGLVRPRIAIAGIAIESSTFSPHLSGDDAFVERRGQALREIYPFLAEGTPLGDSVEWIPVLQARALPGGAVLGETYRRLRDEIVSGLTDAGPLDGLYLDIHGAMSVVGMRDAEADLLRAIRAQIGGDVLVSASMDLHGNVSRDLLDHVDLVTCYRMAPHEDEPNTKERALHLLVDRLRGSGGADPSRRRPYKAWVTVPVLLPGEKTSTRIDPARRLYQEVIDASLSDTVLDASLWVGYAWADEPRCQAAVVVTGDDPDAAAEVAERLARNYWAARDEFVFVGPTASFDEAIDKGLAADAARPFLVSDSGDNPTAGGAGDVSWSLQRLLDRADLRTAGRTVVHASIFDPVAVDIAVHAGIGQQVSLDVGARIDSGPCGPARLAGVVETIVRGDPVAGTQVVIRSGGVLAILTERRKPFHRLDDFRTLGIDPVHADVIVVKIGYLEPELHALAADWILALTPGGVDQDLLRLGHHGLAPGVFPFDRGRTDPDLSAVVLRGTVEIVR